MLLSCDVEEDSQESLGLQGDPTSPFWRKSVLNIHWKDWCWSWSSNPLATWCKELTHLKRPWCWERLKAGGEGDNRGWDGWMASATWWTWVWVSSGSWWTGKPGMLQSMGFSRQVALTRWTFVSKVMSLLFNMLSRFVIVFLPRSKHLLIFWLQSPSAVILEPPKIVSHCFHCFPLYLPWSDGTRWHDLSFLNVEF